MCHQACPNNTLSGCNYKGYCEFKEYNSEIRPCPFCGSSAQVIYSDINNTYCVQCTRCFASMGNLIRNDSSRYFDTRENAVYMWNSRRGVKFT